MNRVTENNQDTCLSKMIRKSLKEQPAQGPEVLQAVVLDSTEGQLSGLRIGIKLDRWAGTRV